MPGKRKVFKTVKKGEWPLASEWNKLCRAVSDLTGAADQQSRKLPKLRLVRMNGQVGADQSSESADYLRAATLQWYNGTANEWQATNPSDIIRTFSDPYDLVWDDDQLVVALYYEQAGLYIPVNFVTVRHAITCRDDSNRYPKRSDFPDTYPIKFVFLDYQEAIDNQGHTLSYLDSDDGQDDFVHNIVDPAEAFIPVGTLIQVYHVQDRWFCQVCCEIEDSSVSGSDSSFSSSSPSDSSSSSLSSSSISASGSSSSSVSSSSASSSLSSSGESSASSGGSSASSDGLSTSEQSEESSDQSSGEMDCVTVLTSVTFNEETCILTWCSRQICFPSGLGITVSDENC